MTREVAEKTRLGVLDAVLQRTTSAAWLTLSTTYSPAGLFPIVEPLVKSRIQRTSRVRACLYN
jgi:hypothetical protein